MENWKEYQLKDATTIIGDGLHGTPKYDDNGTVYFINGNNLVEGRIEIKDSTKRVSENEANKHRKELNNRTILVSINGTIGNVAKYNGEPCILGKSACYFNVSEDFYLDFIYYVVASKQFKNAITHLATGTTIKNVSLETMRNYSFMAPGMVEQKRIADLLSSFDKKIALNRHINDNLEQQAQALFKSWFVDFEPFKGEKFVESEMGMIPEGWKVGNLLDVAEVLDSKRKPLSAMERSSMNKVYPYYGATSIMDYVDDYLFDGIYLLMGEDGSVITENGFPYLQYVSGKFWVNNHAHIMQGKNAFTTEMLHCLLLRRNISEFVTGAVQAKISQNNIKRIKLAIAPVNVLESFSKLLDSVYSQIRQKEKESKVLCEKRDLLLPKLMSGELKLMI